MSTSNSHEGDSTPLDPTHPQVYYIPFASFRFSCIHRKEPHPIPLPRCEYFQALQSAGDVWNALPISLTSPAARPRITISINAPGESIDQDLLTLDVPLELTVADLKGMVEADTSLPAQKQNFYLNGQALRDDKQTLEQAGVKDGEMLAMMVSRRNGQAQGQQTMQAGSRQANRPLVDANRIEETRRRLAAEPQAISHLIQTQPEFAQVVNDPDKFRQLWEEKARQQEQLQRDRETEMAALNDDPYNAEAQKRIEEIIRRENIESNLQYAYENNPEGTLNGALLRDPHNT